MWDTKPELVVKWYCWASNSTRECPHARGEIDEFQACRSFGFCRRLRVRLRLMHAHYDMSHDQYHVHTHQNMRMDIPSGNRAKKGVLVLS